MFLRFAQDRVILEVRDNGDGFDLHEQAGSAGLGLQSMRERLRSVSGSLRISSAPGGGTRVHAEVPINHAALERAQTSLGRARNDQPNVSAA